MKRTRRGRAAAWTRRAVATLRKWELAAVLVAVGVLGLATFFSAKAGGEWNDAVRAELVWSAGAADHVHKVYANEAPAAYEIAVREERARALRQTAAERPDIAAVMLAEASTEHRIAASYRLARQGRGTLVDERYRTDAGYDPIRRLADLREEHPELTSPDAAVSMRRGDRHHLSAILLWWIAAIAIATYIASRAAIRRRHGGAVDVNTLLPGRVNAALIAWLVLTLVPGLQQYQANTEQRSSAVAAQRAARGAAETTIQGAVDAFTAHSARYAVTADIGVDSRELTALDKVDEAAAYQIGLAAAERASLPQVAKIGQFMQRTAEPADGLDRRTLALLQDARKGGTSGLPDLDVAELASRRSDLLIFALIAAAASQVLLSYDATSARARRRLAQSAATMLLIISALAVITAFLL